MYTIKFKQVTLPPADLIQKAKQISANPRVGSTYVTVDLFGDSDEEKLVSLENVAYQVGMMERDAYLTKNNF